MSMRRAGNESSAISPRFSRHHASGITPERVSAAVTKINSIVADLMEQTGVPGIAMAVFYQHEVVHLAGYGERKVGTGEMVDADTVFQLASVSKCLAATTVAAVVGDGLAGRGAKIINLDPTFAMYDPWVTREVTVRDLFSHRSGLAEYIGDDLGAPGYDRAEILHRIRVLPPEGRFRDHYVYTNFGLGEAAFAVAYSNGVEWEDLALERLYKPLGMTGTSSRFDFMAEENRTVPIDGVHVAKYQRQPDAESPAGGVSSSVRDSSLWLRLLLGNGAINGEELVDAIALGETFRPTNPAGLPAIPALDQTSFYGLGWGVGIDDRGNPRFSHAGAFALGAATVVIVVPGEQFVITVLANAFPSGLFEAITFTVNELVQTGEVTTDYLAATGPNVAEGIAAAGSTTQSHRRIGCRPVSSIHTQEISRTTTSAIAR